jgi:hypothetical protein
LLPVATSFDPPDFRFKPSKRPLIQALRRELIKLFFFGTRFANIVGARREADSTRAAILAIWQ